MARYVAAAPRLQRYYAVKVSTTDSPTGTSVTVAPARLDLTRYPHLPQPFVAATRSADYATLLAGGAGHG